MLLRTALLQRLAGAAPRGLAAVRGVPLRAYSEGAEALGAGQLGGDPSLVYDAEYNPDCRNAVVVTGNLGTDLTLNQLPSGAYVASVNVAVPTSKDKTSWFRVEMYSPLAEAAAARVGRGSKVTVTGVLREDTWVDKATNSRRSKVKIIAQSLGVLAPRGASQQQDSAFDGAPSAAPPPPQQQQAPFYGQQGQQQQWAQQEQQQQQQQQQWAQQAAPGPTPPQAPASEVEAHWLSVLNEPNKWWDNRTNKRNPKAPDYKSKDGDIALWIDSRATPEWVLSNLPPTQG